MARHFTPKPRLPASLLTVATRMLSGGCGNSMPKKAPFDDLHLGMSADEATVFEGAPHDFYNFGRRENKPYEDTVEAMDKFLGSLGWLTGPPTIKKQ